MDLQGNKKDLSLSYKDRSYHLRYHLIWSGNPKTLSVKNANTFSAVNAGLRRIYSTLRLSPCPQRSIYKTAFPEDSQQLPLSVRRLSCFISASLVYLMLIIKASFLFVNLLFSVKVLKIFLSISVNLLNFYYCSDTQVSVTTVSFTCAARYIRLAASVITQAIAIATSIQIRKNTPLPFCGKGGYCQICTPYTSKSTVLSITSIPSARSRLACSSIPPKANAPESSPFALTTR